MRFNHPRLVWRMYCEVAGVVEREDAVAALLLGGEARGVGLAHHGRKARGELGDRDHAHADPDLEGLLAPDELPRLDRIAQLGGRRVGELSAAVLHQHRELVAADARERLALAQARLQDGGDAPQQLVAREVAEGIVDAVEEVDVEVEQCVGASLGLGARQRALESLLERLAVRQPRERIVVGEEEDLLARRVELFLQTSLLRLEFLREAEDLDLGSSSGGVSSGSSGRSPPPTTWRTASRTASTSPTSVRAPSEPRRNRLPTLPASAMESVHICDCTLSRPSHLAISR